MTPDEFMGAMAARGYHRQVDIAVALRVTQSTVSRWLRALSPIPPMVDVAIAGLKFYRPDPPVTVRAVAARPYRKRQVKQ